MVARESAAAVLSLSAHDQRTGHPPIDTPCRRWRPDLGRGSNLQAIIRAIGDGRLAARIGVVISNSADAGGLEHARAPGSRPPSIEHKRFESRAAFEEALVARLVEAGASVICLAGFMRILSPFFLERAPGPVLNVHPSLLPAFPGVDAQHQAWTHGVKVAGATVHLVTPELDAGPIVAQATVAGPRRRHARVVGGAHPGRGASHLSGGHHPRAHAPWHVERPPLRVPAERHDRAGRGARKVTMATSGGQSMRHGSRTVPTPRLTNSEVSPLRPIPCRDGKLPRRDGAHERQRHLSAVRVPRQHQRQAQRRGFRSRRGSCASRIVNGGVAAGTRPMSSILRVQ